MTFREILKKLFAKKEFISPGPDLSSIKVSKPERLELQLTPEPPKPKNPWEQYGRPASHSYGDQLRNVFGDQADEMDSIMRWGTPDDGKYGVNYGGENMNFDPNAKYDNKNGSQDRGLFMVNSNTFADFLRRKPQVMQSQGLRSHDDMYDPELNMRMAKVILDEQGYGAWNARPPNLR